ncbi:MAG: hypothetical protein RRZ85_01820 [Gordonibacter sp.]|uniref:hypothetical protein n=1 Tax=Gordonibacter sp. TaxID=1968902 RepID=UPI002FCB86A1
MIKKSIKVVLAALLVFMVAAPVIVGVYDATSKDFSISRGHFEGYEGDGRLYPIVPSGGSGADSQDDKSGYASLYDEEIRSPLTDWYSGDPSISDNLASGDTSLIYEFSDGSTVDFGNPYVLDFSDVSLPSDYDQVMFSVDGSSSIFTPEKAYASPITWLMKKLNYLAIKSGYWKTAQNAIYSLMISGAASIGMSAPMQNFIVRMEAQAPAMMELISKEGIIIAEEDAAMVLADTIMVATQRGLTAPQITAQMPKLIQQQAASINATGTLLGGSSSNFMNAMYQILATNQVSASFLASNADFFTTLFSFLGAELTSYHDIPSSGATSSSGTLSYNGIDYEILFESVTDMLSGKPVVGSYASWTPIIAIDRRPDSPNGNNGYYSYESISQLTQSTITLGEKSLLMYKYGGSTRYGYAFDRTGSWVTDRSSETSFKTSFYSFETTWVTINPDVPWQVYSGENLIGSFVNGVYSGDAGSWKPDQPSSTNPYNGQVIGADAEFDANGNLVNAGNVNVSDITAPGYVQPNTYQDALDQMHAAATDNIPAKPDSPAFGNNGTLGDWVNQNKPQPPAPGKESSQDDFKVQDLEKVFPFSIPWDLYYLLAIFAAEPVAPNFNWRFDFAMVGEHDFAVDLAPFDPVAQVCRACETVLFCIGLALITRNLIRG